jgi:chemotaxis protein MotB
MPPSKAPNRVDPAPAVIRPQRFTQRKHGGAWKVAYADFVTALMALFIVLWMMNSSNAVKQSITGYFHDPKGYKRTVGAGPANAGEGLALNAANMGRIRERIEEAMRQMPDFQTMRDHVKLTVTGEGLRIDLMETEQGMFFIAGSPNPTEAGTRLLRALATELSRMPNNIVIEGHTDARPFRNARPAGGYGNWELSVDRANAARRLLHEFGVRPEQVVEIRGYADLQLIDPAHSTDPRNRRVSVVVKL